MVRAWHLSIVIPPFQLSYESAMPIVNRLAELHAEITQWRREIHQHPELMYDVERTAGFVEGKLGEFGCDQVVPGIGRTGVVGLIRGNRPGPTIGLRADMDALPILEETGKDWASKTPGKMHACGHDGHTSMLLGAAKYLCETRNFAGSVAVIFQPAEEGGAGADAMVKDGMMERFDITEVFGMHNLPGLPVGEFATNPGPIMASVDVFEIEITGKGGHAAFPHQSIDPILVGSAIVMGAQSLVARTLDPLESGVVSITCFNAGTVDNVIPETAKLVGTIRALKPEVRMHLEERLLHLVKATASAHGAQATVDYQRLYPPTVNHGEHTDIAVEVARDVAGDPALVNPDAVPMLGGEDFSFMLNSRPGNFIFMGNGDTAGLHHPRYDFNDEAIPHGTSYWVRLVEKRLALS